MACLGAATPTIGRAMPELCALPHARAMLRMGSPAGSLHACNDPGRMGVAEVVVRGGGMASFTRRGRYCAGGEGEAPVG